MSDADQVELRGMQPRHVVDVLDAVSMHRRIPRNELVAEILSKWAEDRIHEADRIHAVTRGNPCNTDASRNHWPEVPRK